MTNVRSRSVYDPAASGRSSSDGQPLLAFHSRNGAQPTTPPTTMPVHTTRRRRWIHSTTDSIGTSVVRYIGCIQNPSPATMPTAVGPRHDGAGPSHRRRLRKNATTVVAMPDP